MKKQADLFQRLIFLCGFSALVILSAQPEPVPAEGFHLPLTDENLKFGSITLYVENDKFFAGTDRHYTQGLKLTYLSRDLSAELAEAPRWVRTFSKTADRVLDQDPDAKHKVALGFGQNIYTPENTSSAALVAADRPYAAWLYLSAAVHAQSASHLDIVELQLGIVGPSALGRQIQNGWHDFIGVPPAEGWGNQLRNEIGLIISAERRWRFTTKEARTGWGLDAIPHVGLSLGNVQTYLASGLNVRAGWRLPRDFGNSLIRASGDSGPPSQADLQGLAFHIFGATETRAVAHNIFLDGNTWHDSHSVDRREIVVDLIAGAVVRLGSAHLTYAQVYRTREFYGQANRDVFGSVSLSWHY